MSESPYVARRDRFELERTALAARSLSLSNLRGLAFLVLAGSLLFALFVPSLYWPCLALAALAAVAFGVLIGLHARVIGAEQRALRWAWVNAQAASRVAGEFAKLPYDGRRYASEPHPFADDLDLFGERSLFQRLCVAGTRQGQDTLARWLREPATADVVAARQAAVRALSPELEARQTLEVAALGVLDREPRVGVAPMIPDPEPLLAWAEEEPVLSKDWLLRVAAYVLPPLNVAALAAYMALPVPLLVPLVLLVVSFVILRRASAPIGRVFGAVSARQGAFSRYAELIAVAEQTPGDAPLLTELRGKLTADGQPASRAMASFATALGWFELRHNGLIHPLANLILLWDVHCMFALERWQLRAGRGARRWFTAIGELEALSSLAALAHDEPDWAFAELASDAGFEATALAHPLIVRQRRVPNDVTIGRARALLVTGSNMSGKSTLLRAIGVACVLALAGAPVCARRLRLGPVTLRTSLRVSDSLGAGVSHFLAEVHKIRAVVEAATPATPVLFLLDEVLHGTNSRERQIGARWVLAELLSRGALGALSTHDEGLVELPAALATHVELVHLRELVENGVMTFDYLLRAGPVTSGNALRLMRSQGLQVPLEE